MMLLNISSPEMIASISLVFGFMTLICVFVSRVGKDPSRSELLYCIPIIWMLFFILATLLTSNFWILVVGCALILLPLLPVLLYRRHQDHITLRELRTWSGKPGEQPMTLNDMKALAESRGGTLLSDQFINVYKKLRWKCGNGHDWYATPSAVYRGYWCPLCTWRAEFANRRYQLQTLQKIAVSHSGMCLSTQYVNDSTPLRWQCARGHQWDATPKDVRKGGWCPRCT
jgi:hypothetical protein